MKYAFPPPPVTALPVASKTKEVEEQLFFPVHRIYCVGRNYAAHVTEMGGDPRSDPPVFFTKPRDAVVFCKSGADADNVSSSGIPYPLATRNLHYEIELVVAIGKESASEGVNAEQADDLIFGYAVGVDLTRRDLQAAAKQGGRPWDSAKAFDQSAPMGCVYPKEMLLEADPSSTDNDLLSNKEIWLDVNGQRRQSSRLGDMTWSVPEIVAALSQQFQLQPGDLIMTGTPSGVGPIEVGDVVTGGVKGLGQVSFRIVER